MPTVTALINSQENSEWGFSSGELSACTVFRAITTALNECQHDRGDDCKTRNHRFAPTKDGT